jgi:hypothetical protein
MREKDSEQKKAKYQAERRANSPQRTNRANNFYYATGRTFNY